MNRAKRRAQARAARKHGAGWTRPTRPESQTREALVAMGAERMAYVAANLDRLPLTKRESLRAAA